MSLGGALFAPKQSKRDIAAFFAACGIPAGEIVFFENFRLDSKILRRKDWLDKWQADSRMMPLGRKFMLVPFWQKKEFRASAGHLPIYLDPKAAF